MAAHMNDAFLFNESEIFGVLHNQTEAVKKRIQAIHTSTLLNASDHDLVEVLMEEFRLRVPVIDDEGIYIAESREAQVDVSRDPMRMIHNRSEAFYVPGNKTIIALPFKGDLEFFRVRPSSFSLSPLHATIVKGELLLTYVRTDQNAGTIKSGY